MAEAIAQQADGDGAPGRLGALLQLAAAVAARDGYGLPGEPTRPAAGLLSAAGVTEAQAAAAIERAEETFKRLRASVV
jgi:hypothetical protein